jgi:glycine/serine hydroxymethyltransferase
MRDKIFAKKKNYKKICKKLKKNAKKLQKNFQKKGFADAGKRTEVPRLSSP